MYQQNKSRHLVIKIGVGIIVIFLAVIAAKDWTPESTPVEKTVVYGQQ